ncbi:MAG: helix-turn-helix domain-containing protein [Acidobacteriia bacterium]|nr:helix-turn-helix domain-containing protein [Terriglobia bacterium]
MEYCEIAPQRHLAETVECFWTLRQTGPGTLIHRVVPDGCADIIFSYGAGEPILGAVGAMTRFEDFPIQPGQVSIGVRFRPAMWTEHLRVPADRITDKVLSLEDLWGAPARRLRQHLGEATSSEDCISLLAAAITPLVRTTPLQCAVGWMEAQRGTVRIRELARECGLSPRQFQRTCLSRTGLSPKLLARVLRFRHALARVRREAGEHAGLAADCGYADQSHLIAEFRLFSGRTPAAFARAAAE